jgi:hypothetical protein
MCANVSCLIDNNLHFYIGSPNDIDYSIISIRCPRSSAVQNDLGHPVRRGWQDAENDFLPSAAGDERDERDPGSNEKSNNDIYFLDCQELENGYRVDGGSSRKRRFRKVLDHNKDKDIRRATGNTSLLACSKRTEYSSSTAICSALTEQPLRLACPYHRKDPRKYNIQTHRACASRHWDSVSRVKFVA